MTLQIQASNPLMDTKGITAARCIDVRKTIGAREMDYLKRARTIDKIARFAFPVAYVIFNTVFWIYYMYLNDPEQ
jgi:uncharacterized membrane protein